MAAAVAAMTGSLRRNSRANTVASICQPPPPDLGNVSGIFFGQRARPWLSGFVFAEFVFEGGDAGGPEVWGGEVGSEGLAGDGFASGAAGGGEEGFVAR